MTIYLCRHGQTTGDIEDRYGGDYDDHLTDEGLKQAADLADNLSDKSIEYIYCSPKIRALETAKSLISKLNCEVEIIQDLRERNQNGILTGMIKSEAKAKYPELAEKLKDYKNTITGAESYEPFSDRVNSTVLSLAKKSYKTIAIVTHGGPIKAVLRKIKFAPDYKIADCAYVQLESDQNDLKITRLEGIEPLA